MLTQKLSPMPTMTDSELAQYWENIRKEKADKIAARYLGRRKIFRGKTVVTFISPCTSDLSVGFGKDNKYRLSRNSLGTEIG